ncbi:ABC transporter permease [Bifidobacterium goeldii]|uniref:ABC transporter permease n=1 Tax=Bifidobacterium goeldii TaxID=2306975 RepID=A0A430FDC9_9BIFI|nr:FtsX-like permease family protein [Bifidobacterium goeldii]RSX50820.1 ABC transporter permease [Bifidobacterium goeldii]
MARGRHARARGQSRAFAKDTLRMWAHNWKRFASIAIISMLGVAVLTGIYAGCRDMFQGADRFLDTQRLYDIQVVSTLGLTDDDVAALKAVNGVTAVQSERSAAASVDVDGSSESVTLSEIGADGMNQPYLQDGRMPSKAGDVAVTRKFIRDSGLSIGDTLSVTLKANTADSTSPSFPTKLTITGIVLDPTDLQNPDGYSQGAFRSSATSEYTFFMPSDGVTGSTYTAISVEVSGASSLDTFTDVYDNAVRTVRERIESDVQSARQKARRQQLIDDAKQKIADARAEADQQFNDAQNSITQQQTQFNQQIDAILAASGAIITPEAQNGTDQTAAAALQAQRDAVIAANAQLTQAKAQLAAAQSQLDQQKTETYSELDKRAAAVEADIPQARWYVNTRASAGTFSSLKSDLSSIESIGRAFPIVFLAVAVLMSLTAMTRMVEEDRGLIGTYMGLGYGPAAIAARYVLFALLACLIGGGLGDLLGFLGIPAFLLIVLEGMYVVPGTTLLYDWVYGSAGVALFVVGIAAATIVACRGEVRRMPAELMRPKAPKAGSRVLLERIGPLWRRMKFLNKVTARNLFRFKGRLFMTIGGVAGCTALIVCGLAINDTVDALPVTQYQDVYRYSLMVVTDHDDVDAVRSRLIADGHIDDSTTPAAGALTLARVESGEITTVLGGSGSGDAGSGGSSSTSAGESETVQLITVPYAEQLANIVDLRSVTDGSAIRAQDLDASGSGSESSSASASASGVIVSQSAANALDIKAGDTITLENGDAARETAHVYAVSKSVIGSDVYMTSDYYREIFGGDANDSNTSADSSSSESSGNSETSDATTSDSTNGSADAAVSSNTADTADSARDYSATKVNGVAMNAIFARYTGSDDAQIAYADKLSKESDVLSVVSVADMQRSFSFDLMGAVVALIVALAGALALVVLFTLANTNVSERVREMATLKVLGFFDREVHRYVNREMMILTLMGIVVGLPLGRWIGGLLTAALNMPGLYFAVTVRWTSYAIAAAVTLAFALLVQLFTNPVLDRIDPVSSLKSVE